VAFLKSVSTLSQERISSATTDGIPPPKIGYIYISGLWVHGTSPDPVTDRDMAGLADSPSKPMDIVGWRPQLERAVLGAKDSLDVCIIRPAQMYGYSSAAFSAIFGPIAQAVQGSKSTVSIQVPADALIATCHVDDVANAIRLAAEKIELVGSGGAGSGVYPIFDIIAENESLLAIAQRFADVMAGGKGKIQVELTGESQDVYMAAMSSTIKGSGARAKQYLGWEPKRQGMAAGIEVWARAWEASLK
jgi:nucleoside-diphosphate-sugar epimerase